MPKVIVLDNIAQEGLDLLEQADNIEFVVQTGLEGDELKAALLEADGAICRSGVSLTEEVLTGNSRLKVIVRAGVGTDNIDKPAATRQGIIVMNTPTGNTFSTAEHAMTLMLALSRNVAPAFQSLREGRWDRKAYMGSQLSGKTLGVVGLGRVGQEVAKRAQAFQMKIVGFDPFLTSEQAAKLGVELCETVHEMLPRIDYLTVHTPLTPQTKGLISHEELALLKPGARLVNCARGGIYDESALAEGLDNGILAGVALDVFETEPCTNSPLFQKDGVVCTPHLGASTEEAQTQVAVEAVELAVNFLTTGAIRHAVNVAAIDPTTLETLAGYLELAYRMGIFLDQWDEGGVQSVKVEYRGHVADEDTKLLTASLCAGLLKEALEESANIVNSQVLLKDRGIEISETHSSEMGAFASSMTVTLQTDKGSYTAGGTVFGKNMPRLIRLDDMRLESYLDGNMLIFVHDDLPGIIGFMGSTLGMHEVNIAQMSVGRAIDAQPGGRAIGVLNLDSIPSAEVKQALTAQEGIQSVKSIELPNAGERPPWM
ncbi:MAG: phosphoglycerate dehydrogenase [Planctomycetaceae bacterium]|nr:phosphoglycerate dehydrogenase [Planctomycetaceae bacterium]|tara:strand:- start:29764 stop:31389 length:1626 start_codon:yes stop_codon:yes gene_type:complete